MRSWSLFLSSMFASVGSVLSLVIPFCLFLNFYHGDLFVSASDRSAQRGIEVIVYLTPMLILIGFMCFSCIFRLFASPIKIFEPQKIFKLFYKLGFIWFGLIFFFQFLDGRMAELSESLYFGLIGFIILIIPLFIGVITGHFLYLYIGKGIFKMRDNKKVIANYKALQIPPL